MKVLKWFAVGCLLLTIGLGVEAAPPLRSITMPQADGKLITIKTMSPAQCAAYDAQCAAMNAQAIGSGTYLQHSGSPRILTILAAFQDVDFTVNTPVQAFEQYLSGDRQVNLGNMNQLNVASVRQYYEICSHGQFSPQFDVVGPVTLPQKMAYYGGSNASGSDDRFYDVCNDALTQAKPLVSDWSIYDNDQDGRIELVCIIFAGYGQNQGGADSTIWAKAAVQNIKVDDKLRVSRFNCCSELFAPAKGDTYDYSQYINGTGVFIHEMSHCMGLPDLYATQSRAYVNNQGMETWSVMDYGLYNYNGFAPCPFTAWEQEVMGWTEIEEVEGGRLMVDGEGLMAEGGRLTVEGGGWKVEGLLPLIEGGKAYKIVNADNDRDYIVMENVQKTGLNRYASGHGLLVYHVNYPSNSVNMTDAPNNNPGRPSVAVVPAGGLLISSYLRGDGKEYSRQEWAASLAACPFPGTKNVSSLTPQMELPNYCFYDGSTAKSTGYMLSDITEDTGAGTVSFSVATDETVGVGTLNAEHGTLNDGTAYDLQGRRIGSPFHVQQSLKPGLYIVNGRKIAILR